MGASILLSPPRTVDVTVRDRTVTVRELTIAELPGLVQLFDEMTALLAEKMSGTDIVRGLADRMIGQVVEASREQPASDGEDRLALGAFLRQLTPSELLGVLEHVWALNRLGDLVNRKLKEVLSPPASG